MGNTCAPRATAPTHRRACRGPPRQARERRPFRSSAVAGPLHSLPSTLHLQPSTLYPLPSILYPPPFTLHSTPCAGGGVPDDQIYRSTAIYLKVAHLRASSHREPPSVGLPRLRGHHPLGPSVPPRAPIAPGLPLGVFYKGVLRAKSCFYAGVL